MQIADQLIAREQVSATARSQMPSVALTLAQRRRSRQKLTLDDGQALGVAIERGQLMRDGDVLQTPEGRQILVRAARERVLRVTADSPWQLARAAYHLGNRHVLLEIGEGFLQLEFDAVLVDMLQQLGSVHVEPLDAAFEPDVGAYGGGHHHGHDETFEEDYALAQAAYHAHERHHVHARHASAGGQRRDDEPA